MVPDPSTVSLLIGFAAGALAVALLWAWTRRRARTSTEPEQVGDTQFATQLASQEALLEALPGPVFVRGPDTRLLYCNRAYERAYGVARASLIGSTVLELSYLDPKDRQAHQADCESLLASGGQRSSEQEELWADGQRHTVLYQRQAFDLADGRRGGMVGVLTDVTALKQAEAAAHQSAQSLQRLLDAFPGYAVMTDKQLRYVYANRAMAQSHGLTPEALIGRPLADVLGPRRAAIYRELAASPPGTRHVEERVEPAAGGRRRRFFEVTAIVGPADDNGEGVDFAFGIDVTHARRGADYERLRSRVLEMITRQAPLKDILDRLVEGIQQMAPQTRCCVVPWPMGALSPEDGGLASMPAQWFDSLAAEAPAALGMTGESEPVAAPGGMARLIAADLAAQLPDHPLTRAAARAGFGCCWCEPVAGLDGQTLGMLVVHYDRAVEPDRLDLLLLGEVGQLVGLALDRQRTAQRLRNQEAALLESRRQLQVTFESMQDGFLRINGTGVVDRVNQAMADMLGCERPEEVVGLPISAFYAHDEDRLWVRERMVVDGRIVGYRCQARRRDGRLFWVDFTAHRVYGADGSVMGSEGVVRDISRQIEFEQALKTARDAAQAAAESKSNFLANMSHEIRTPMNAIIGLTQLALRTELTAQQADYLGKVHKAAHSLLGLINRVLDLSKIESGRLTLETVPFRLDEVMSAVADLLADQVRENGVALRFRCDPDVPRALLGDPMRLGQVLTNLVANARKFTEQGHIEVQASLAGGESHGEGDRVRLRVQVRDTGIGLSPEQVQRLFQPFSQGDESITRRFGGTGLGLAISRQLVEMMGGRIWVDSELGVGSTFGFEVVLGLAPEGALSADQDTAWGSHLPANAERPGPRARASYRSRSLRGARVLLVEDNAINRQVATELLTQAGIIVEHAADGQLALDALARRQTAQDTGQAVVQGAAYRDAAITDGNPSNGRPSPHLPYDCVLMDLQMPVMDGYTATQRIRANPAWAALPVLAMTANVAPEDRARAAQAGMNDHIAKPIDLRELLRTLRRWVRPTDGASGVAAAPALPVVTVTADELPASLPGLDMTTALRNTGGSPALLKKLLHDLLSDHGQDDIRVIEGLRRGDVQTVQRLAHTLKGVAGTLGARSLQEAAAALETALRAGQAPEAQAQAACDAIAQLMRGLRAWTALVPGSAPHPAAAPASPAGRAALDEGALSQTAQPWDPTTLQGALDRLHTLLREMDPEAAERAAIVHEQIRLQPGWADRQSTSLALREHARRYDFDTALAHCQTLRQWDSAINSQGSAQKT